jgi:RimJ/RimL family protein N-acetyltransferase
MRDREAERIRPGQPAATSCVRDKGAPSGIGAWCDIARAENLPPALTDMVALPNGTLSPVSLTPAYPVRSARLLLRPLSFGDIDALLAYRSLPEVCRYVPFSPMGPADIVARLHGQWACRALAREGDALVLGAELADEGQVIGDVMLRWISAEHGCGEIGYVLNPLYGGRGLAAEAAHAVLHLAFDDLGLHRVIARVDARNTASARLAARLGMRQEAHLVENEWFKGEWTDELDFALLAHEWRSGTFSGCEACSAG